MLYKVGDEEFRLCYGVNSHGFMDKYAGTVMTIMKVLDDAYIMFEDQNDVIPGTVCLWFEDSIQGLDTSIKKSQLIRLLMKG